MAIVLSQSIRSLENNSIPVSSEQKNGINSVTSAIWRALQQQQWKPLSEIIDALYEELPKIQGLTLSDPDNNENITATIGDNIRLALALGITNTQAWNILLFGRKEREKEYDTSGNKNPNLDLIVAAKAILSKWSTIFKAGDGYLGQILQSISFTGNFAYEQTDSDGDAKHIIMPVFAGTTESGIQIPPDKKIQAIHVAEFARMNPGELTAKAEAYRQFVIKTLR